MSQWRKALSDWSHGLGAWGIWLHYGIADIRKQYKRTFLGPVWAGVSAAIFVFTFAYVGSELFANDARSYVNYLAVGYILYNFLVSNTLEFCSAFNNSENLLNNGPLPRSVPLLRTWVKNLLALAHTLPVIALVALVSGNDSVLVFHALLGLLVFLLFTFLFGVIAALLNLRYRDTHVALSNVFMITFFMTPVLWRRNGLPEAKQFIVDYNPIAQLLDLVRMPVAEGTAASAWAWHVSLVTIAAVALVAAWLFVIWRRKVTYWL
ncbi:MAG: sugar ABC transporter permease [Caldimonas sp.]|nr:MAG: sugar ABC transporter permease [Caldimonas sp.]